jgi:hypothetical protein
MQIVLICFSATVSVYFFCPFFSYIASSASACHSQVKPPDLPALVFATSHLESLDEYQAMISTCKHSSDIMLIGPWPYDNYIQLCQCTKQDQNQKKLIKIFSPRNFLYSLLVQAACHLEPDIVFWSFQSSCPEDCSRSERGAEFAGKASDLCCLV